MADITILNAAVEALTAQVAATETIEASAIALIGGYGAAVTKAVADALMADNAADDASIVAAKEAIAAVTARFTASAGALGDAVVANTPQ